MLSIDDCKTILNNNGYELSDSEIAQLRDFLTMIAVYQVQNTESDEKSDSLL